MTSSARLSTANQVRFICVFYPLCMCYAWLWACFSYAPVYVCMCLCACACARACLVIFFVFMLNISQEGMHICVRACRQNSKVYFSLETTHSLFCKPHQSNWIATVHVDSQTAAKSYARSTSKWDFAIVFLFCWASYWLCGLSAALCLCFLHAYTAEQWHNKVI